MILASAYMLAKTRGFSNWFAEDAVHRGTPAQGSTEVYPVPAEAFTGRARIACPRPARATFKIFD